MPGRIIEIVSPEHRLARVDFEGVRRQVNLGLLAPGAGRVGDWVTVQAGMAVGLLSEAEAQAELELLRELERMFEEELS